MLLALLLGLLAALSRSGPAPILDPATYRSPGGEVSLLVDPSSPDAAGPGTCELRRGSEPAWRVQQPWTFRQATVTDEGFTAGYAVTRDGQDPRSPGRFHAVILRPDGSVLRDEHVERSFSRTSDSPPGPNGLGVFHVPELGRVVFRVRDRDHERSGEQWWCFEIPSGRELWRRRPRERVEGSGRGELLVGARSVAGTPLTLVEWRRSDHSVAGWRLGVHLALLDADLEPVWQEIRDTDGTVAVHERQDRINRQMIREGTLTESPGSRRFGVISPARSERVVYEVERGSGERSWTVREVERAPHEYLPDLAGPELATVRALVEREVPLALDVLAEPSSGAVDAFGRALVFDEKSAAVHAFDAEGRPLFVCRPEPGDFGSVYGFVHPTATFDRGVLIPGARGGSLRFAADGSRVGIVERRQPGLVCSPSSGLAYGLGSRGGGATLVILDGELGQVAEIARRPDGCWLADAGAPAVSADGTIGIVCSKRRDGSQVQDSVLALYSSRGEALRQIAIPAWFGGRNALALGRRHAVVSSFRVEHRLVDLATGTVSKLVVDGEDEQHPWSFAFAADGEELIALDAAGRRILHFALSN